MKILGVIPARYASTRFPGKPLAKIMGYPMLRIVYEAAKQSELLDDVIIAIDDDRVHNYCWENKLNFIRTSDKHKTGTDRVHEVVQKRDCDLVVNIQGDEPLITGKMLDKMVGDFIDNDCDVSTIAINLRKEYKYAKNKDVVKVIVDDNGYAKCFARILYPFFQHGKMQYPKKHIGIYMYTKEVLDWFVNAEQTDGEQKNNLEQLRLIENNYDIFVSCFDNYLVSVDKPEHIKIIEKLILNGEIKWQMPNIT